ncbi:chemotaxis protein CheA [Thioclava kandeliae]|uniref:Chemotaxis protein CheA n=1 Tax=Thioclava kandeliae TaxID=3070818 RepID=A0ABV1SET5_9RHOB
MSMDDDAAQIFLAEALELQASIEANLLDLKSRPADRELIDSLFRELHTLKGSSAMFGHSALSAFVHEFETAFETLRQPGACATDALIKVALAACDQFLALLDTPELAAPASPALLQALADALSQKAPLAVPAASGGPGWRVTLAAGPAALGLGISIPALLQELRELDPEVTLRADLSEVPPLEALNPLVPPIRWSIRLPSGVTRDQIDGVFVFSADDLVLDIRQEDGSPELTVATGSPQPEAGETGGGDAPPTGREAALSTMRVATERLDELMDRVGELVIAEARLHDLSQEMRLPSLMSVAEDIRRLTSGMRDTTMSIRMVPIGTLFGRFRRLIHDLSDRLGKPIDFVTLGGETELDKTVIETLADPLVHLLRNSIDHGLEDSATRAAQGKSGNGRIELSATHAGAEVLVRIRDDGRGLDLARIRARGLERGLITEDQIVTQQDLRMMIFAPGFSTAETVTDLSGRGVGMDVVRSVIEGLRGQIEVSSEPGYGTEITLRLPLTLAIIDGLLIEVGQERYTIPVAAVEECVELPPELAQSDTSSNFLNVRGGMVPFIRLADLFDVPGPRSDFQKVVIVTALGGRVGVVVDRLVTNNQTVIKQLSRLHAGLKSFSGATILGDGTVALILDVANLVAAGRSMEEALRTRERVA